MTRSPGRHWLLVAALTVAASCSLFSVVWACPYSIRDSSFVSNDNPTTFRMCLLTRSDAPDRDNLVDAADTASATWLVDSNVLMEIVDVDLDVKHELQGVIPGRLLDPALTPAAVLISPRGEALPLDWPDGSMRDAVMDVTLRVIQSPLRRRMAELWPTAWCALLVISGDDDGENKSAVAAAHEAAARIHGTITEMDKLVEHAPEVIVVPHDSDAERLVLWSLGLTDGGAGESAERSTQPAPVRVATLVGRGELRGPVLTGAEISSEKIYDSLVMLGRSCSCTTNTVWLRGPVLPLEWTDATQQAVLAELDFDPNDPTAAGAIRDVVSGLDQALGYQECTSGYRELTTPDSTPDATIVAASAPKPMADESDNVESGSVESKAVSSNDPPSDGDAVDDVEADAGVDHVVDDESVDSLTPAELPGTARRWDSRLSFALFGIAVATMVVGTVAIWSRRGV
ncbi:MAG: hypothetical protein R3C10_00335 [Pirellulales bacterium]